MYSRILKKPISSTLLLGPRGTGKSTWIRENFPEATSYDFLDTNETLRLSKEPNLLYQELQTLSKGDWVVLDEVQKVPALLDEVQRLIEEKGLNFLLCGSSARKLKKSGANLLAGRALLCQFFPFVSHEVNYNFEIAKIIQYGLLPMAFNASDPESYLKTYAQVYLQEEIKNEALTRNIGDFARFLEIAARQNGQVTNISNISREASVGRLTVQSYFDILVDTLIGHWLQPWKLKRSTKQIGHPKFYFFDPGVVRALSGRLPYPPTQEEYGHLLETLIYHELRAYLAYNKLDYPLYFWSSYDKTEVDFLFETPKGFIAIECKGSTKWENKFNRGLKRIQQELSPTNVKCYGIFNGPRPLKIDQIKVFPVIDFLKELWQDKL